MEEGKKHFVLVHGAAHGAWCWYKLIPLLKSSGHKVTALDLGASGVDPNRLDEIATISDYARPLMEFMASLPEDDGKVILVGHSFGGYVISLVMEMFPQKVLVAVFVTAEMPNLVEPPATLMIEYCARATPRTWLDTEFAPASSSQPDFLTMLFGPEFLCSRLYQLCSKEDLELGKALVRPSSLFLHDLSKAAKFTEEGYGSVRRVFVICNEDQGINEEFQRWMIQNYVVEEVMEIKESDHMAMLCEPRKLFDCLSQIANNYTLDR
ncbi:unnamed protein product [Linum tenue]|uniref:(S)-hydroxynitrile lyase n=1 Tax=Linum tenue TaxID=586396 RepID=A0AAV0R8K5_9ROSI|nr:unnamed protein product [Linum tenue]